MFLDQDFILENEMARILFHNHAKKQPIIDYHCHLNPKEIHENKAFEDLSQIWLFDNGAGDHYKMASHAGCRRTRSQYHRRQCSL